MRDSITHRSSPARIAGVVTAALALCSGFEVCAFSFEFKNIVFESPEHRAEARIHWDALAADSDDPQPYYDLAVILRAEGYPHHALEVLEYGFHLSRGQVNYYVLLATLLIERSREDAHQALFLLDSARRWDRERADISVVAAQAFDALGDQDKAIRSLERVLSITRDNALRFHAHLALVGHYRQRGDDIAAERHVVAAREISHRADAVLADREIAKILPKATWGNAKDAPETRAVEESVAEAPENDEIERRLKALQKKIEKEKR